MSTRAERLAADLKAETLAGLPRALAEEMVLTLERMERIDKILQGDVDAWAGILERMPDQVAEVTINAPLAEARQQALAFKALAAEYTKLTGAEVAVPAPSQADDLKKRRDAQRTKRGIA